MWQIITSLFSKGASDMVDKTMKGLDSLFTSDEERMKAKALIEKQIQDYNITIMKMMQSQEENLTKRHQYDMQSDSWLSKNIRPMTLIAILTLYTIFSLITGIHYENGAPLVDIEQTYIELLGQWGIVVTSFYFGGRTLEKGIKSFPSRKNKQNDDAVG